MTDHLLHELKDSVKAVMKAAHRLDATEGIAADNVEQIFIGLPAAGAYTIHIGHTGDPLTQDYSLPVSGASPLIPEPGGLWLAALCARAVVRRRRR